MGIDIKRVHGFFNKTENYLCSNSTLLLRRLIVSEILGNVSDSEIIDIGCGNGMVSKPFLEQNHVTFLDLSKQMLEKAKEDIPSNFLNNANFYNSSLEDYKPLIYYDIVILLGVLAHVKDIEFVISKIASISKAKGLCIVQITNNNNLIAKSLRLYSQVRQLFIKPVFDYDSNLTNKKRIKQLFEKNGFSLIDQRTYFPTFPGFSFLKQEIRTKFLLWSYKSKLFASLGSEKIFVFKKKSNK